MPEKTQHNPDFFHRLLISNTRNILSNVRLDMFSHAIFHNTDRSHGGTPSRSNKQKIRL